MDCAMRLFQPQTMAIFRYDGRLIHMAAGATGRPRPAAGQHALYPMPADEHSLAGRVILRREAIAVDDTQDERHTHWRRSPGLGGWRRMIAAPMLKDGVPMGTVHVAWADPGQTPKRQIDLLKTFADQAVIAIENVRLINETNEALARQTATSDVLQVISESPTDVQPVFDIIAERAAALTAARYCLVTRFDGEWLHLASLHGVNAEGTAAAARRVAAAAGGQHVDRGARDPPARRGQRGRPAGRVRRRLRAGHEARGRTGGLPQRPLGADAARRADRRRDHRQPRRDRAVRRQGSRAAADLRPPGGGGDRERAPVQRDARRRWSSRPPRPTFFASSATRRRT